MKHALLVIVILSTSLVTGLYANSKVESEFLEKMIKHHESGVEMSEVALQKTKNKNINKLAQTIKDDQSKEVDQFKKMEKSF